jgi:hypothetical protein
MHCSPEIVGSATAPSDVEDELQALASVGLTTEGVGSSTPSPELSQLSFDGIECYHPKRLCDSLHIDRAVGKRCRRCSRPLRTCWHVWGWLLTARHCERGRAAASAKPVPKKGCLVKVKTDNQT